MRTKLTIACALILAGVLVAAVRLAHATYPGGNGRLAFAVRVAGAVPDIYSLRPDAVCAS